MKRVKPIAKVNLIRISDAYIIFKRTIVVAKNAATDAQSNFTNKKIIFKNCAPFTDCISEGKNTEVDNGKNIDVVKSVYNVIEFRYNYSKTSRSLWLYCRDEPTIDNNGDIIGFSFLFFFFFLLGFYFTTIHESQDCRGRGRAFLQLLTTNSTRFTDT